VTDRPPLALRIRKAILADHLVLCRLWQQVDRLHATLRPDFFAGSPDPARSKFYLDRILEDGTQEFLVATPGDAVLGFIHLQCFDTPEAPVFARRRRVHIEDLVVDEAHRRRGVGRALMRAAEEWARRQRAQQIVLTVWQGNADADAFYARVGYAPVSHVLAREL
jgi:GNAT superfamily N-acetyltransferase